MSRLAGEILSFVPRPASIGPVQSTHEQRSVLFDQATAIVEREFSRPITADEVAARVACSPRQLRRVFTEVGGTSFRAFVMRVRMTAAARLLVSTDLPVKQIASRVGYREPGQFTKAFKRAYAVAPSRYRQQEEPVQTPEQTTVE